MQPTCNCYCLEAAARGKHCVAMAARSGWVGSCVRCAGRCRMVPAQQAKYPSGASATPTYQQIAATPGRGLLLLESLLQLLPLGNNGCPC
jgi:hypothetical protein